MADASTKEAAERRFQYTTKEATRIANTLPDFPHDVDEDRYKESVRGRLILDSVARDKSGKIARTLEQFFHFALEENIVLHTGVELPNKNEELAAVERIDKLTKKLRAELAQPTSMRTNYATLILGKDKFAVDHETNMLIATDRLLMRVLKMIEDNQDQAIEKIDAWHNDERFHITQHNRSRAMFVGELCDYWEYWTGERLAASKSGGKAAPFVRHAINPVLIFMRDTYGQEWHPNMPLTEESQAAEMITAYLLKRPTI